jgi:hypothetical protein
MKCCSQQLLNVVLQTLGLFDETIECSIHIPRVCLHNRIRRAAITHVSSALKNLHLLTHTIREAFYVFHHGPKHFITEFCNYMAFYMLFMYFTLSLFLTCSEIQKDVIVGDAV